MGSGRVESLRFFDMALRRADRTRSSRWQPFIGTPVRGIRVDWQNSADGCPPTVWAVQLDFGVQAVTIAMGEAGLDGPRYQPDGLLVIFDRTSAEAYRIPAAIDALEENRSTCVFCRMETDRPQVDHAIPRSKGGNATPDNAQTTCPHCNASKGARDRPVNPPSGYRGPWPPP